jgi:peptidoglycan hydrolase-like protein with peptidoglycan-binding domain
MGSAIGPSTSPSTATNVQTLPIDNQPASFRYCNPGAQFPNKEAARFGQLGYGLIDHGQYKIALFPNSVNGAAANFDLLNRNYTGMSIGAAGTKWTGGNGFGVPGYDPRDILTTDMLNDQTKAIALLKAIAGRESGHGNNLTEEQWRQAHDMFLAGSADAYLKGQPAPVVANPTPAGSAPTGAGMLARARQHLHEAYDHVLVPKDNAGWKGPWDCSEFVSWLVYQEAHVLYGCEDDSAAPAKAKAYTGDWKADVEKRGIRVPVNQAASTVGGILLRYPPGAGQMGHIVLCDGAGGTVEAKGKLYGVVADTVHNRSWDTGILIPGINYNPAGAVQVIPPADIYAIDAQNMDQGVIKRIQTALLAKGFNPGVIDGEFGPDTQNAVVQFQDAQGLTVDGQVGPETAAALGISLKPDPSDVKPDKPGDKPGPVDPGAQDPNLAALIAALIAMLSKETSMAAADPSKPGQNVDPTNLLLLLLLQSMLGGQQINLGQFLGGGQTSTPPAAPAPAKPAPPAGQGQPPTPSVNDLVALLLQALLQKISGQAPAAPAKTPAAGTSGNSPLSNPSVQLGAAGFGITTLLQLLGQVGMPFNLTLGANTPTTTGTIASLIPLVVAGIGMTGGWGSLINIGSSLIGAIANAANKPKS